MLVVAAQIKAFFNKNNKIKKKTNVNNYLFVVYFTVRYTLLYMDANISDQMTEN